MRYNISSKRHMLWIKYFWKEVHLSIKANSFSIVAKLVKHNQIMETCYKEDACLSILKTLAQRILLSKTMTWMMKIWDWLGLSKGLLLSTYLDIDSCIVLTLRKRYLLDTVPRMKQAWPKSKTSTSCASFWKAINPLKSAKNSTTCLNKDRQSSCSPKVAIPYRLCAQITWQTLDRELWIPCIGDVTYSASVLITTLMLNKNKKMSIISHLGRIIFLRKNRRLSKKI